MKKITTRQGDTWDIISKREYGSEMFMDTLISANISHRKTVLFPAGVMLDIPDVDTSGIAENDSLPVWKRNKG